MELGFFYLLSLLFWKYFFPGKQINAFALSEAAECRVIMEHCPEHNKIHSIFKELQSPDNSCKSYVMQVNWGECRDFKTRVLMVEVARNLYHLTVSVIHEGNLFHSCVICACYPHVRNFIETPQVKISFTSPLWITSVEDWVFKSLLVTY